MHKFKYKEADSEWRGFRNPVSRRNRKVRSELRQDKANRRLREKNKILVEHQRKHARRNSNTGCRGPAEPTANVRDNAKDEDRKDAGGTGKMHLKYAACSEQQPRARRRQSEQPI